MRTIQVKPSAGNVSQEPPDRVRMAAGHNFAAILTHVAFLPTQPLRSPSTGWLSVITATLPSDTHAALPGRSRTSPFHVGR